MSRLAAVKGTGHRAAPGMLDSLPSEERLQTPPLSLEKKGIQGGSTRARIYNTRPWVKKAYRENIMPALSPLGKGGRQINYRNTA